MSRIPGRRMQIMGSITLLILLTRVVK